MSIVYRHSKLVALPEHVLSADRGEAVGLTLNC